MKSLKKPLAHLLLLTLCLGFFPGQIQAAIPLGNKVSPRVVASLPRASSVSKTLITSVTKRAAPARVLPAPAETFITIPGTGERIPLGSAKNNQVLTFIDGKIVWRDPSYAASGVLSDFVHEPGSGRMPSADSQSRRFGGGPVPVTTTTTTSGISQTTADARYVNVSGDTMDGALTITSNGLGLVISGTASGNTLHATRLLTVSGTTVFDGNARFNSTLTLNGVTYSFPSSDGTASGKVLKTNAAGQLSWSDDNNSGGGGALSQTNADLRYVNQSGDTMTGALVINLSSGFLGLKIIQSASTTSSSR